MHSGIPASCIRTCASLKGMLMINLPAHRQACATWAFGRFKGCPFLKLTMSPLLVLRIATVNTYLHVIIKATQLLPVNLSVPNGLSDPISL